jgi:hypothetical protein
MNFDHDREQSDLLNEYARRHDLCLEFDTSEYDQSRFAAFSLERDAYPAFTLIWDSRSCVLVDDGGYTLAQSTRMTEALGVLTLHLQSVRAMQHR